MRRVAAMILALAVAACQRPALLADQSPEHGTFSETLAEAAASDDPFEQHHLLMIRAIMDCAPEKVKALLGTHYIIVNRPWTAKTYLSLSLQAQNHWCVPAATALLEGGADPYLFTTYNVARGGGIKWMPAVDSLAYANTYQAIRDHLNAAQVRRVWSIIVSSHGFPPYPVKQGWDDRGYWHTNIFHRLATDCRSGPRFGNVDALVEDLTRIVASRGNPQRVRFLMSEQMYWQDKAGGTPPQIAEKAGCTRTAATMRSLS